MTSHLADRVVADYIAAVNAFDTDAHRGDLRRGRLRQRRPPRDQRHRRHPRAGSRRRWSETTSPWTSARSSTTTATRSCAARYDGTYDKTNLPDELVLSNYFSVRDGKIVSLAVIFNQPSPY